MPVCVPVRGWIGLAHAYLLAGWHDRLQQAVLETTSEELQGKGSSSSSQQQQHMITLLALRLQAVRPGESGRRRVRSLATT